MPQLRTVRLYGALGARFGRVHQFVLESNSIAEAMAALRAQVPGFVAFLQQSRERGLGFAVFVGQCNVGEDELVRPSGAADIRIAPVLLGSKQGGLFQVILGVVLIVVGSYTSWAGGGTLVAMGISMVAGGIVQMLSPQPRGLKNGDRPDNQPSYVFNGPVNTQAQGNPVPLLYGRMRVGSAVASAGIEADEYAAATAGVTAGAAGADDRTNFYA